MADANGVTLLELMQLQELALRKRSRKEESNDLDGMCDYELLCAGLQQMIQVATEIHASKGISTLDDSMSDLHFHAGMLPPLNLSVVKLVFQLTERCFKKRQSVWRRSLDNYKKVKTETSRKRMTDLSLTASKAQRLHENISNFLLQDLQRLVVDVKE